MEKNLGVRAFVLSTLFTIFACSICAGGNVSHAKTAELKVKSVKIDGYVGRRIDDCISHRVMEQDVDALVEPFRHRTETWRWQSEFWGKWTLGAIETYRYTGNAALYEKIAASVGHIIETQSSDGYIGNYAPEAQLKDWDIWGRKYTMLGLLSWYELSGDTRALSAASRVADHLISQLKSKNAKIVKCGLYRGMASSSVLEPIMKLYNISGDKRYLDFATDIVSQWESPDGP